MFRSFCAVCAFIVAPALADSGGIGLEVRSPSPFLTQATNSCDWTYQALVDHQWTFEVMANIPTDDNLMLMVREKGWGVDGCPIAANGKKSCSYACNVTKHAISSQLQYEVKAEYRSFTTSKFFCIDVNHATPLTFVIEPGDEVMSTDGYVNLNYSISGYPLPATITLKCAGLEAMNYTIVYDAVAAGLFRLQNLSVGVMMCQATAFNRVSRIFSNSTLINVTATGSHVPQLGVEADAGSSSSSSPLPLQKSVRSEPTQQHNSLLDVIESSQHATGLIVGVITSCVVMGMLVGLIVRCRRQRKQVTIVNNQNQVVISNNTTIQNEVGTSKHYMFIGDAGWNTTHGNLVMLSDATEGVTSTCHQAHEYALESRDSGPLDRFRDDDFDLS